LSKGIQNGLALRLIDDGLLSAKAAEAINERAIKVNRSFVSVLLEEGSIKAQVLAVIAAEEFGAPLLDLNAIEPATMPQKLPVSEKIIQKSRLFPIYQAGNTLYVALADPTNFQAIEEARFASRLHVEPIIVNADQLDAFIEEKLDSTGGMVDMDDDELDNLEVEAIQEDANTGGDDGADDAPVVKFVNNMLLKAIRGNASDLHFEPYERLYRVRFRIDGVLQTMAKPPLPLAPRISARLKIMSAMDIAEKRKPQDGRIKLRLSKTRSIDFRVNSLPTLWGEKIVLRILDASSAQMGIESLGFEDDERKLYEQALSKPQGMILVTGPTGSGKTVSLYTGLNILNDDERNISTAEDPVEINLQGVNQVNINVKAGLTFAEALRAFLRQDPDVVMVGEIRDLETAEIAIKAAQTGHLVLSTLHTNSAAETLTRLMNMGVPTYNLASSITIIIAQRLARRLCKACKKPINIPKPALQEAGFNDEQIQQKPVIYTHVGCDQCNGGYKGRVGIYEVLPITKEIANIIMEQGNSMEIARAAKELGFRSLHESGLLKVIRGETSLEELERVTIV
jgi:type IV pilus assembly protein PilB